MMKRVCTNCKTRCGRDRRTCHYGQKESNSSVGIRMQNVLNSSSECSDDAENEEVESLKANSNEESGFLDSSNDEVDGEVNDARK